MSDSTTSLKKSQTEPDDDEFFAAVEQEIARNKMNRSRDDRVLDTDDEDEPEDRPVATFDVERKESCAQCGRPGRSGDAFEGLVLDQDGRCGCCGYPYRGLPPKPLCSSAVDNIAAQLSSQQGLMQ